MTHLANSGQSHARILAGLSDAVAQNVQVLIKPNISPARVALFGGVARSPRIRRHFREYLEKHNMSMMEVDEKNALFIDAVGCAVLAANGTTQDFSSLPALEDVYAPPKELGMEMVPALADSLSKVRRLEEPPVADLGAYRGTTDRGGRLDLILGMDIGSTGSKMVALDAATGQMVWQTYTSTNGRPVDAAQDLAKKFTESDLSQSPMRLVGVTGSGREIVGSLMNNCFESSQIYVLNEIAAHAQGALSYDSRVDTVFEIGGQDAKYIRLSGGRVIDAAMNEACSAGTGSFIEEQGKRFPGIENVQHLGQVALEADAGVSLGQHCSVFMAEIIDEAAAAGAHYSQVVAGI